MDFKSSFLSLFLSLSLSLAVSPVSSLISSSFRPLSRARAFASVQQQTVKGILSIVPFSSSKKDGQASSYNIPIPYPPFPPCTIIRRNERERERTSYHVARPRQKASNSSTLVTYRKSFLSFWKKNQRNMTQQQHNSRSHFSNPNFYPIRCQPSLTQKLSSIWPACHLQRKTVRSQRYFLDLLVILTYCTFSFTCFCFPFFLQSLTFNEQTIDVLLLPFFFCCSS